MPRCSALPGTPKRSTLDRGPCWVGKRSGSLQFSMSSDSWIHPARPRPPSCRLRPESPRSLHERGNCPPLQGQSGSVKADRKQLQRLAAPCHVPAQSEISYVHNQAVQLSTARRAGYGGLQPSDSAPGPSDTGAIGQQGRLRSTVGGGDPPLARLSGQRKALCW